ncbi:MAG: DUF2207 domain-containing protein, partial [Candidatus Pacebacteria bacterium]|nr:DUF2207 domain-containing protein [Candidatus Paceibacterota bacterium]
MQAIKNKICLKLFVLIIGIIFFNNLNFILRDGLDIIGLSIIIVLGLSLVFKHLSKDILVEMKIINKIKSFFCFCFFGLLFSFSFCQAEEIESFYSKIMINDDSSLNVTETIVYDFGNLQKHGIYRYFKGENGANDPIVSSVSVTNENGNSYQYTFNNNKIKIGDELLTVWGKRTYVINYNLKGAINYSKDYDELYLNVNGFGWQVPIKEMKAEVIIPKNLKNDSLFFESYYGVYGAKNLATSSITYSSDATNIVYMINSLNQGENFTVLARFPKGIVEERPFAQKMFSYVVDNWMGLIPLIPTLVIFITWIMYGRKPKGRGTIIPQYDVADNLTPIEIGTIKDEKTENIDVSAEIIYLATKGYLSIRQIKEKFLMLHKTDYLFTKTKEAEDNFNEFDKELLNLFFKENNEVKLSKIDKSKMESLFYDLRRNVSNVCKSKGYFKEMSRSSLIRMISLGYIFILCFFIIISFKMNELFYVSTCICLFVSSIILSNFSKTTKKGAEVDEHIKGLKLYLSVAEKDRIKFHNAPDKNPTTFEKFLPYAMILGVEKEWAKQFESLYVDSNWYKTSDNMSINSTVLFVDSLNSFSDYTKSYFSSKSSS